MVTSEEMHELLAYGHETRPFEVKGPGSISDNQLRTRVARAAMAMGNLRDGGIVCVGIDNGRVAEMQPGLNEDQFAEWSDPDRVGAALAPFCDPPVSLRVYPLVLSSGAKVVALVVSEFETVPHVCKRPYPTVLQEGMTYVRARRQPESVPVPSSSEMRELLDLAVTKGIRDFVRRAHDAGLLPGAQWLEPEPGDRQLFDLEEEKAWSDDSDVLAQVLSAGHSDLSIRPGPYNSSRVPAERLVSFITDQTVRLRGWPVPFTNQRSPVERYGSWIGQGVEPRAVPHLEVWRFCSSGQFLQRRRLATDIRSSEQLSPTQPEATGSVAVWDVLLYAVEAVELGTRLVTSLDCHDVTFKLSVNGISGRELVSGDWSRELHGPYLVVADTLVSELRVDAATLIADPRSFGVQLAQGLLRQFGLDVPDALLKDWQATVFDR